MEATAMEAMAATVAMEAMARGQLMPRLTTVVAMEAMAMEAMAATAAMEAMARGQLMPRLTTVVAMEATAMEAMEAMARGQLMLRLTMVVAMEATDMGAMAAMAAMDMATESNSSKEQIPHNLAPPNLIPDSQSVNPNLKLLYHDLNPLEIQFQLKSCN